jgi:hypothetical protein
LDSAIASALEDDHPTPFLSIYRTRHSAGGQATFLTRDTAHSAGGQATFLTRDTAHSAGGQATFLTRDTRDNTGVPAGVPAGAGPGGWPLGEWGTSGMQSLIYAYFPTYYFPNIY